MRYQERQYYPYGYKEGSMSGRVTMEPDVVLIPYGEEIPASHVYICIMVMEENEMRLYTNNIPLQK